MRETERPPTHRTDSGSSSCLACGSSVEGARCGNCGASVALKDYVPTAIAASTSHSRVYIAETPDKGRVAVKELLYAQAPSIGQIDDFEREARILGQLDHPAIPKFLGHFREGEGASMRLYTVQQFVEGQTLAQLIAHGPIPEAKAKDIASQLLDVLDYLHTRVPPVIHRDVKPANIVLREDGKAVLVDFGVARVLPKGVTHGATVVGTFGYSPLEQLGGTATASSDLYALGATLLHALTGIPPDERLSKTLELDLEHPAITPPWRFFLERPVARDPSKRFNSAAQAKRALTEWRIPKTFRQRVRPALFAVYLSLVTLVGVWVVRDFWPQYVAPPPTSSAVVEQLRTTQIPSEQHALLMQLRYGAAGKGQPLTRLNEDQDRLIAQLIQEGYPLVRTEAAGLLSEVPSEGTEALDAALRRLGQPTTSNQEGSPLIRAVLRQLKDAPARLTPVRASWLEQALLGSGDPMVRLELGNALIELHPLPPQLLTNLLRAAVTEGNPLPHVLKAILISHVSDVPITEAQARQMATSQNSNERHLGLILWAKRFPSPEASAAAQRMLQDADPTIREDAKRLLGDLK